MDNQPWVADNVKNEEMPVHVLIYTSICQFVNKNAFSIFISLYIYLQAIFYIYKKPDDNKHNKDIKLSKDILI